MRKSQMSSHNLLKQFIVALTNTTKYPTNKSFQKEEIACIKEMCRRLDIDYEEFKKEQL